MFKQKKMEDNKIDQDLYTTAMKEALKVEFLESNEEIKLYAASLYNAMIWGINHTVKVKY